VTPGCVIDGPNRVRCPLAGFTTLTIVGSDLNDAVDLSGIDSLHVCFRQRRRRCCRGRGGVDLVSGVKGDDVLIGGPGLNKLFGGPGDNLIVGPSVVGDRDPVPPDPDALPRPVPEPGTLLFVGLGLGASALSHRRCRNSQRFTTMATRA
jgi:PEP-CTERM motif/RTX calcium-binding nonapeptide repeat (4 copies)